MVRKSKNGKEKGCSFCKSKAPHMVVVMNKETDIHVHAPFDNLFLMEQFQKAIRKEYTLWKIRNKKNNEEV